MGNFIEDNRKSKRFDIRFPATIRVGSKVSIILKLCTRDISSNGVFICSKHPLKNGIKVNMEIVLENDTLKRLTGSQSSLKVHGTVVRCEPEGMAVKFNAHKITPRLSLMNRSKTVKSQNSMAK